MIWLVLAVVAVLLVLCYVVGDLKKELGDARASISELRRNAERAATQDGLDSVCEYTRDCCFLRVEELGAALGYKRIVKQAEYSVRWEKGE